jgi:hypothetical protein
MDLKVRLLYVCFMIICKFIAIPGSDPANLFND